LDLDRFSAVSRSVRVWRDSFKSADWASHTVRLGTRDWGGRGLASSWTRFMTLLRASLRSSSCPWVCTRDASRMSSWTNRNTSDGPWDRERKGERDRLSVRFGGCDWEEGVMMSSSARVLGLRRLACRLGADFLFGQCRSLCTRTQLHLSGRYREQSKIRCSSDSEKAA
jgi:glycine/D-amino acid oxidase-like deaminating enzyme